MLSVGTNVDTNPLFLFSGISPQDYIIRKGGSLSVDPDEVSNFLVRYISETNETVYEHMIELTLEDHPLDSNDFEPSEEAFDSIQEQVRGKADMINREQIALFQNVFLKLQRIVAGIPKDVEIQQLFREKGQEYKDAFFRGLKNEYDDTLEVIMIHQNFVRDYLDVFDSRLLWDTHGRISTPPSVST